MRPAWVWDYIQIPFEEKGRTRSGADCWGLYKIVKEEKFHVYDLPEYLADYDNTTQREVIEKVIERELAANWYPVARPEPGVLIHLRALGRKCHVGIMTDREWFLHCMKGAGTRCTSIYDPYWKDRILGYHEYGTRSDS